MGGSSRVLATDARDPSDHSARGGAPARDHAAGPLPFRCQPSASGFNAESLRSSCR